LAESNLRIGINRNTSTVGAGKILATPDVFLPDAASMSDKRRTEAIAAARGEIARRIVRFCTALSPEEFDALLDRMVKVQWKYQVMPMSSDPADAPRQLRELLE
jgi:uncharacterized membrane protein